MNEEDIPTELELAAMLKVLMSLPKKEVEKLVEAYCGEDESKSRSISYNSAKTGNRSRIIAKKTPAVYLLRMFDLPAMLFPVS